MNPRYFFQVSGCAAFFLAAFLAEGANLQQLIDQAAPKSEVLIPKGKWDQPVMISKPLTLRGESQEETIIELTSDQPALQISCKEPVTLESLTVRWQRATSARPSNPQAALVARDASVVIRAVRFEAPGSDARCPSAVTAVGFSDLQIIESKFRGYQFTVQVWDGAKGSVRDSVFVNPGHCGVTAGPGCALEVARCVVTGSAYHGIRSTGGELRAHDNLVISNKNRGIYLGNKSATGTIENNVIYGNGTGISGFHQSQLEVKHNLIAGSNYAGLDARGSCQLKVAHNVFLDNARGLVVFLEGGKNHNQIGANLFWGNKTDTENFEPAPEIVKMDPQLKDPAHGDFRSGAEGSHVEHGLRDARFVQELWQKRERAVASP